MSLFSELSGLTRSTACHSSFPNREAEWFSMRRMSTTAASLRPRHYEAGEIHAGHEVPGLRRHAISCCFTFPGQLKRRIDVMILSTADDQGSPSVPLWKRAVLAPSVLDWIRIALLVAGVGCVLTGLLPIVEARASVERIAPLMLFLASVIVLAELTKQAQVFDVIAARLALLGRGPIPRSFCCASRSPRPRRSSSTWTPRRSCSLPSCWRSRRKRRSRRCRWR